MKKYIILFILVVVALFTNATNYYIKTGGAGTNTGLSDAQAWDFAKVNTFSFAAGDSVLFKRGDTFYGTITPLTSGTVSNNIVFAAYGATNLAKPVITGFTAISSWTNEGGGIYSKVVSTSSTANMLSINGVNTALGRYPNTTYLTIDAVSTYVSITDAATPSTTTNWTGAQIVIRKEHWIWDRAPVTAHSGNVITYTSPNTVSARIGFGFFFQRDLRTLDTYGEWYHGGGKLSVYFGAVDPTTVSVKLATLDKNAYVNAKNYITFSNLDFQGANLYGIHTTGTGTTIKNCNVSFAGDNGIYGAFNSISMTVDNCNVTKCNNRGIYGLATYPTIKNNYVHNIALNRGMGGDGATTYTGICTVQSYSPDALYEYNRIDSIGYNGIAFSGSRSILRYNYISNYCMVLDDGSATYTAGNTQTGRKIYNNIIVNDLTRHTAALATTSSVAEIEGIYCDNNSRDIDVYNNTIIGTTSGGIFLHGAQSIRVHDNIIYNTNTGMTYYYESAYDSRLNLNITRNQSFSVLATQYPLYDITNINNLATGGLIDSNYYMRPVSETGSYLKTILAGATSYKTLATWRTYSGQDYHSAGTPYVTNDIQLVYNPKSTDSTITLSGRFQTVYGIQYTNTITLAPFTSKLLFRDETYVVVPEVLGTVVLDIPYNLTSRGIDIYASVTFDGGGTISERGLVWGTSINPTILNNKQINGSGLGVYYTHIITLVPNTIYYMRAYVINEAGVAYSNEISFRTAYSSIVNSKGSLVKYNGKVLKY